ncbi:FAD binding domain-containing protein [uncultured Hymenobacter sp.]|uniref:FAD binding domain-containing protein n=1 Tax=uncultured Hymenobacter sp. TaxID=170016 RepID=UPI0035CBAA4B
MKPFDYLRPSTLAQAMEMGRQPGALFVAGSTTAVDLMKYQVWQPQTVIDIRGLPLKSITFKNNVLTLPALETMTEAAYHPAVVKNFPVVSQSLLLAASQQLRNAATVGGNLLQRTRCPYFRDPSYRCNRREPGAGCDAIPGVNRNHAILGGSASCIATHASDLCVALVALDAQLVLQGVGGERVIPLTQLHLLPGTTPEKETTLQPGELITAIRLTASEATRRSRYLKVRERNSYAFALAAAAVGLDVRRGVVQRAHLALGGVGTVPWKAPQAEAFLQGKAANRENFTQAARLAVAGAAPQSDNAFKIELVQHVLVQALEETAALA